MKRLWGRASLPCGYCGKAAYPTQRAATEALRALHHHDRAAMNTYRCNSGGVDWHVGHRPRTYEWPGWDDANRDQQCGRCPAVIRAGEPVASLGQTRMCFDCGDLAEQAAIGKAAS